MSRPTDIQYTNAIQNPKLCFSDTELQRGAAVLDDLSFPWMRWGGFAVVFQIKAGAKQYAVRCFKSAVTDQQRRYEIIGEYLKQIHDPAFARVEFQNSGIRVEGQWYPIVKMEWVVGQMLDEHVGKHLSKPGALIDLRDEFRRLVKALRDKRIAHGDLQHRNIMVTPSGRMRLVDYDGMFVPGIVAACGPASPEVGHQNFQHPRRVAADFNENIDNFSALVTYLSLWALVKSPDLWRDKAIHTEDNLIFQKQDFVDHNSKLMGRLVKNADTGVRKMAEILWTECRKTSASDVRDLEGVLHEIGQPAVAERPAIRLVDSAGAELTEITRAMAPPLRGKVSFGIENLGKSPVQLGISASEAWLALDPVDPFEVAGGHKRNVSASFDHPAGAAKAISSAITVATAAWWDTTAQFTQTIPFTVIPQLPPASPGPAPKPPLPPPQPAPAFLTRPNVQAVLAALAVAVLVLGPQSSVFGAIGNRDREIALSFATVCFVAALAWLLRAPLGLTPLKCWLAGMFYAAGSELAVLFRSAPLPFRYGEELAQFSGNGELRFYLGLIALGYFLARQRLGRGIAYVIFSLVALTCVFARYLWLYASLDLSNSGFFVYTAPVGVIAVLVATFQERTSVARDALTILGAWAAAYGIVWLNPSNFYAAIGTLVDPIDFVFIVLLMVCVIPNAVLWPALRVARGQWWKRSGPPSLWNVSIAAAALAVMVIGFEEFSTYRAAHGDLELLRGYVSRCRFCIFRSEATKKIAVLQQAQNREDASYRAATGDLERLRAYVRDCHVCTFRSEALTEIATLERTAAQKTEDGTYWAARGNLDRLRSYVRDCRFCTFLSGARAEIQTLESEATLRVCNFSRKIVWLVVVGRMPDKPDVWMERGWWQVDPGKCVLPDTFLKPEIYAWAFADDDTCWGGRDLSLCVPHKRFARVNAKRECSGERSHSFKKIVGADNNFYWQLDLSNTMTSCR